ncbi:hypothetical protein [Breoghania sp. L-A4]|uniref:hypothetical protein n=1 Tax=Breoghania sp. L-A4 TaxID=2304600 RepID=UPI0013C2E76B|nr:hypothetical protein [Breoghania sp. L-A4]
MWTTEKTRRAHIFPRPLRVAYLVPLRPSHALLDAIFDEAMSRWGGRRTPIVVTDGATISDAEWMFLDLWDADLIYSYVPLQDDLHDRIAYCLGPYAIETHKTVDEPANSRAFRPSSDGLEWSLKSISVLPRVARLQEIRREPIFEVLDKERGSHVERDLADSFGFLSNCTVDRSITPYARRLSFREVGHEKYAPRFTGENVISYLSDIDELESRLSEDGRLLFPTQMSDMFCPNLNALREYKNSWEEQLTVIIGDDADDRLLFWNAIHRYASLDIFRNNQIFRFSVDRFKDGLPAWIRHLCGGVRNCRRFDGNGAPNVHVVSCSVEAERLGEISRQVAGDRHIISSFGKLAVSDVFDPLVENDPRRDYEHSQNLWPAWIWPDTKTAEMVRVENREIDLPCIKPGHTNEFPLGPTTVGAWLNDLKIERAEDHSRYSNIIHHWMFPRRLALHRSVKIENYGESRMALRPPVRPTERGCLSLWDSPLWQRPTLSLPQDVTAFRQALAMHHPNTIAERGSRGEGMPHARIEDVKLSDKGRDLLGVLKFFGNLNEAITFLTNPFILSLIAKLSPTDPAENSGRIQKLKGELIERLKDQQPTESDFERAARRVLELAARGLQKDMKENEYANYAGLWQQLKEDVQGKANRNELDDCLKYLRNQNFLLQGFGWKCRRCQHSNWVGLTDITNSLECAICDFPENAPVGGDANFHFKLNPFVSAAFAPTSAQDSIIWCLSLLLDGARHSFMLTPTLDIRDKIALPQGTDLDVLACVDGKVYFYEVKRSFAGINKRQIDDLIIVANLIRPDFAGFAIQSDVNKSALSDKDISYIRAELRKIDVEFALKRGNKNQRGFLSRAVPPNVGDTMRWNIWQN